MKTIASYRRGRSGSVALFLVASGLFPSLEAAVTTTGAVPNAPPAGGGAVTGAFTIGDNAFGSVSVTGGTAISNIGGATVGNGLAGIGTVSLSGFGSDWEITGSQSDMTLGDEGVGLVTISGGAEAIVPDDVFIGAAATGNGKLTISGLGSRLRATDDMTVAISGQALAEISSGGQLTCDAVVIGDLAGSVGEIQVSADLSRLTTTSVQVGDAGQGTLRILSGGRWTNAGAADAGTQAGGTGYLEVNGLGSLAEVEGNLTAGISGQATVAVLSGGVLDVTGALLVGSASGSFGDMEVSGAGSLCRVGSSVSTGNGIGKITLTDGGRLKAAVASTISGKGRLILDGGTWDGTGMGAVVTGLSVSGTVEGDGIVLQQGVTTNAGSLVRVREGQHLQFSGALANGGQADVLAGTLRCASLTNNAVVNVNRGTLETDGVATNAASTGLITLRDGVLLFGNSLANNGSLAAAAGISEVYGNVTSSAAGRITVTGGATVIFYDDLTNNGTMSVSAAGGLVSTVIVLGSYNGNGASGAGRVFLEGDARPGASPGLMAFGGDVSCGPEADTVMEIGGTAPVTQFDRFTVAGSFHRDGKLTVQLINGFVPAIGASFDLLDFDPARTTGSYTALTLPALPAGREWNTAALNTTGTISVIAEGITFSEWAATVLGDPAAQPDGDHDHDGQSNAIEFALGLFPANPAALAPVIDLHNYGDGDRLRVRFTRPLDRVGFTLKVQASGDLVTWTELAASTDSAPFSGPGFVSENRAHPLPEPGEVEVRDVLTTAAGRRYVRIAVVFAP